MFSVFAGDVLFTTLCMTKNRTKVAYTFIGFVLNMSDKRNPEPARHPIAISGWPNRFTHFIARMRYHSMGSSAKEDLFVV